MATAGLAPLLGGGFFRVILCFRENQIFVHSFQFQLGETRRDLTQLEAEKLLIEPAAD